MKKGSKKQNSKTERFEIRLTQDEKAMLKIVADGLGLSIAKFIRSVAIDGAKLITIQKNGEWFVIHKDEFNQKQYRHKLRREFLKTGSELLGDKLPGAVDAVEHLNED